LVAARATTSVDDSRDALAVNGPRTTIRLPTLHDHQGEPMFGPDDDGLRFWRRGGVAIAGFAIACACVPLALADPDWDGRQMSQHLAVDCPAPFSQKCAPRGSFSFDSTDDGSQLATFWFQADPDPPACAPGLVSFYLDGHGEGAPELVQPGQQTKVHGVTLKKGPHVLEVEVAGAMGGCNTGAMSGWSGTVYVRADLPNQTTPVRPPPPGGQPGDQPPQPGGAANPPH
jgi:hypothetical protein